MKLYNTLSRQKEEFQPINPNEVRVYSCGPTVYNFAHIGNLRTYVFMDIMRRVLQYNGFSLKHVMNITDVGHLVSDGDDGEDKMLKGAREQQKSPWEIAEHYTNVFLKDIKQLNIQTPEIISKATDHINEMIEFVEGLIDKGFGYETSDGIYFDISKFEGYGKLSKINLEEQIAGARVEVNDEKHHPADFALWKKAPKEHIMQWESPWGMGYPGWHIECSAMARKYLGDVFDIHSGGVDHIPIHHENEIAQSEGLLGKPAVNYWIHGEFMLVDNGKMSKSLKNTYTVKDLGDKDIQPLAFRYFCLNAHYRSKLNFTWESMLSAKISYERMLHELNSHKDASGIVDEATLKDLKLSFMDAINDDLNIPKALGVAWNAIRQNVKSNQIYELVLDFDKVFDLDLKSGPVVKESAEISSEVMDLFEQRLQARKDKNWKLSDELRDKIKQMGYIVEDSAQGSKLREN
jgi:cysteinyl-tRNA synthetase